LFEYLKPLLQVGQYFKADCDFIAMAIQKRTDRTDKFQFLPIICKTKLVINPFLFHFHFSGGMAKRYSVEFILNYIEKVVFEFH